MIRALLLSVFILFTVLAAPAFAQTTDAELEQRISNLSQEQKAQLAAQLKANEPPQRSLAAGANEWVKVGENIGIGLAGTARELGMAADDIANTSVGRITIGLLIWNFFAADLMKLLVSFIALFALVPIWFSIWRRLFGVRNEKGKIIAYDLSQQRYGEGIAPVLMGGFGLAIMALIVFPILNIG